jgi:hypothetical protein
MMIPETLTGWERKAEGSRRRQNRRKISRGCMTDILIDSEVQERRLLAIIYLLSGTNAVPRKRVDEGGAVAAESDSL